MSYLIGIGLLIVGLLVSIALHEVGHMWPAKKFGVKVPQYFVGFGPTLWSTKRGETEYGIKAIPLGGYVRLAGMYPPAEALAKVPADRRSLASAARAEALADLEPGEEHRAFYRLSTPKKIIVMLAGPVMNLIIAFVLLAGILMGWGLPVASTTLADVPACATESEPCDSPGAAYAAGLRPGDTITGFAGKPIRTWEDLPRAVAENDLKPTEITFVSDGVEHTAPITPQLRSVTRVDGEVVERPVITVIAGQERKPAAFGEVVAMTSKGVTETFKVIGALPMRLYDVARSLVTDEPREDGVMSIIGVGRLAGEVAATPSEGAATGTSAGPGWTDKIMSLLSLIASLNIALFAFNLIPLLPLDGGHIAGALYEGARRRIARAFGRPDPGPVDTARMLPLTYTVFILLIGMTLLLGYADIVKPITL
ncbi:RIP metalloprotease RseP [Bowdeniella nasicola]|uniref:RIP metalloprotease RseP n=1 Tax=Bowdeniella nasicola TaxID=208480 RepID=A0A1H4CYK0_9ACTO|nr:site-2 protease family protein [Bowdeniella nasicola]SEA65400.1 RIP metalloprotease RseP [Bowdeniella nasicola]